MNSHSIAHISAEFTGAATLPEIIDYHAAHNPSHYFAVFPRSDDPSAPTHISFLEFARAAQRFARAVCPTAPVRRGEVVALVANADNILYITAVAGFVRAGLTVFPLSPRNSAAAVCHMLRKVSAHRLMVTAASLGTLLSEVKEELAASDYEISIEELPAFTDIYPHFGFETADMSFEPLAMPTVDAFVNGAPLILHSSGSTGFPKPIAWSHGFLASLTYSAFADELRHDERNIVMGTHGLPAFHTLGIFEQLLHPLYTGRAGVLFRPVYPRLPTVASPETVLAALKASPATATVVVPTFLEIWVHHPEAVAFLSTLEFVGYCGGPLAAEVGDALVAAGCRLRSILGATEFGVISEVYAHTAAPADWAWIAFHPSSHIRWAPQGDGTFELQLLAHDHKVLAVENLPDVRGYATNDLWIPHPTAPDLWKIVGRVDDVLVLANGEKVVPGPAEGTIVSHEAVRGVVMFGRERNQVGVLVEPRVEYPFDPADETALAAFRNLIWPKVEEANRRQPAFARVFKEMILVTQPAKSLPRVGKGTVSRKGALALYDAEIRALYDEVELPNKGADVPPPEQWATPDLSRWILALATSIREGSTIAPDEDLFAQGFDSLSATFLRNHIIAALRGASDDTARAAAGQIGNGFVYAHPSVRELADALGTLVQPGVDGVTSSAEDAVRAMVDKYAKDMPAMNRESTQPDASVVLLTGSTGGLGSQLLATLLSASHVVKVFALNRPGKMSLKARHEATFRDRGLDAGLLSSEKVQFIEGDASAEHLGLPKDLYEEIRSSVTVIIHNAWRLDFNLALSSFEPNVRGTRHLLDLALTATHASAARVLFTSSIAVTQAWPRANGPFPEAPQDDVRWCLGSGYGEGKYVAEQLLVKAAEAGLQTTSFRIGQISGGHANGAWATTDWLPIMVKSSISLGCLPATEGLASWLPFDAVCQAILDVAFAPVTPERALNLVHPRPIAWEKIMVALSQSLETLGIHERLALVDLQTWFAKLNEASRGADDATLRRIPAIKLLDFFGGIASADQAMRATTDSSRAEAGGSTMLATERAQAASEALRTLAPLEQADVARWVVYWKAKKFFDDTADEELPAAKRRKV